MRRHRVNVDAGLFHWHSLLLLWKRFVRPQGVHFPLRRSRQPDVAGFQPALATYQLDRSWVHFVLGGGHLFEGDNEARWAVSGAIR
jgi:hypothetical protein